MNAIEEAEEALKRPLPVPRFAYDEALARVAELERAITRLVRSAWGTAEYNEIERIAAEIKRRTK